MSSFRASDVLNKGDVHAVVAALEPLLAANPQDDLDCVPLADAYFESGQNYSALILLRNIYTEESPVRNPSVMLRASLAAVLNGFVYEGQADYVRKWILSDRGGRVPNRDARYLPQGSDSLSTAFLSAFALALEQNLRANYNTAYFYAREAWSFDPGNPWILPFLSDYMPLNTPNRNRVIRQYAAKTLEEVPNTPEDADVIASALEIIRTHS